ncbi:MAG: hypothetical protein EZS28_017219 [Streblomastix strix]|uniref:Uncharacterized protein n=1 Tax=Streblomastix strix TaxID=222440 RepID=A0A5J4VYH4_9EUKA|nr:MAG: hypothetical protein EZS28_017219 [Streblomastix strix]
MLISIFSSHYCNVWVEQRVVDSDEYSGDVDNNENNKQLKETILNVVVDEDEGVVASINLTTRNIQCDDPSHLEEVQKLLFNADSAIPALLA